MFGRPFPYFFASAFALLLPVAQVYPASQWVLMLPENERYTDRLLLPKYRFFEPRVGLALSGGGSRGISHIGVLEALEENGISISYIVGSSMGSIIGGLYAAGYRPKEILKRVLEIKWQDLIEDRPQRQNLFLSQREVRDPAFLQFRLKGVTPVIPTAISPGQRLLDALRESVLHAPFSGNQDFSHFPVVFRAVATDLASGKKVVFDRGDLAQVMLASSAIPLLFAPVQIDSMLLVDGGILDNLPTDELARFHPDIILAVDATSDLRPPNALQLPWQLADQVTTIMQLKEKNSARNRADVLIEPELGDRTNTDFDSLVAIYRAGLEAARKALPDLLTLIQERRQSFLEKNDTLFFISSCTGDSSLIRRLFNGDKPPAKIPKMRILRTLEQLYRTGQYREVKAILQAKPDSSCEMQAVAIPYPVIRGIRFHGNHSVPEDTLRAQLENRAGRRFDVFAWQKDRLRLLRFYRKKDLSLARIVYETLSEDGFLDVFIDEGRIDEIRISGNRRTSSMIILREFPLKSGDLFRGSLAEKGIQAIYSTGLFENVQPHYFWSGDRLIIQIRVKERALQEIRLRYLYHRDDLFQLQIQWVHFNFLGNANRFVINGVIGKRRRQVRAEWQIDRIFRTYISAHQSLFWSSEDHFYFHRGKLIGDFRETRTGIHWSLGQQLRRMGVVQLQFRVENVRLDRIAGYGYPTLRSRKVSIRLQSTVDSMDRLPFPTRGRYYRFYYEISSRFLGNERPFFKLYSRVESYFTFRRRWTLHPRIEWAFADMTTPFFEMFTLGGMDSFYGFRKNEFWGRRLIGTSLELRYFIPSRVPVRTFLHLRYDLGAIWKNSLSQVRWDDFTYGVGLRCSFETPAGAFSFAYGQNSQRRKEYYFHFGFHF